MNDNLSSKQVNQLVAATEKAKAALQAPRLPKKKVKKTKSKKSKGRTVVYLQTTDPLLKRSVHEAVNSFFFPNLGVHRGQAKAFSQSALALIKGSVIVSNAVAASNIFAVTFTPAVANANFLFGGFGATISAAVATSLASTAISATQAASYRVISAQLTIIPQGSFTNQAGSGLTGYVPDSNNFTFTASNIANLDIQRPFKGVDSQIWHWLPSENSGLDETEFTSIGATPPATSLMVGYISIPTGSDTLTSFQIDYQLGVEYIPTPAYRPFVEKCPPMQDIRANQYVNMTAEKWWNPLMVGKIDEYEPIMMQHVAAEGGRTNFEQISPNTGSMGVGAAKLARDDHIGLSSSNVNAILGSVVGNNDFQKGVINAGLGVFNAIAPGEIFDIPYIE